MAVPTNYTPSSSINQYEYAEAITKSDTTNITGVARALYVGVGGIVVAVMQNGDAVNFTGVASGSIIPIRFVRINSTTTTATNMVALY
tara:strand:- start:707 stop:970 length:264 start_codon:yes stop_codon:yes gene_type:complete